jgi:hypothetical protein
MTILPDFAGKHAETAYDREAREYAVLVAGRPVAWYSREQDAYRHAASVNYREADTAALEARAAVADGAVALAELRRAA